MNLIYRNISTRDNGTYSHQLNYMKHVAVQNPKNTTVNGTPDLLVIELPGGLSSKLIIGAFQLRL
jgi:hypothetical protein